MTTRPVAPPVLPDVLLPGLRVVFCGTAAGTRSAESGTYYAHPGNRFWWALHASGLTPRQLRPEEFPLLPQFGIGLTDVAKHHHGNDDQLPLEAFDAAALRDRIATHAPQALAFTSKAAARAVLGQVTDYGLQTETLGRTHVFVMPSPSGQARGHWRIEPWLDLAAWLERRAA